MRKLAHTITIDDLRTLARRRLPDFAFIPMETGSGDGQGPTRNRKAFERYQFTARALVDVTRIEQKVTLFGRDYDSPFGISAIGYAGNLRRHADQMLAEVAAEANIPFMLSGGGSATIEEIAKIAPGRVWQQLYVARDRAITDHIVGRARDAGVEILVYTVDSPVPPRNNWLARSGIVLPAQVPLRAWPRVLLQSALHPRWAFGHLARGGLPRMEGWAPYASDGRSARAIAETFRRNVPNVQDWWEVERLRKIWPGKLVLKGIMHPDDVARAAQCGADGVTISNHGGNKLDRMAASLDVLPPVARAARGMPLLFDGGISRGSDILMAQALGATFCFVGRAALYGVVAGGVPGARRAVEILRTEIERTLALVGCPNIADIGQGFVHQLPLDFD